MSHLLKLASLSASVVVGLGIATPLSELVIEDAQQARSPSLDIRVDNGNVIVNGRRVSGYEDRLVALAATMQSGRVTATDTLVAVAGVAPSNGRWTHALANLRDALPTNVMLDNDVFVVDPQLEIGPLCARMFARISDAAVEFRHSGSELRTSSHAALDRIVSFANTCDGASILIIGHSDATGDEVFNRMLSLRRAQAVANYLTGRGVPVERLHLEGRGSTEPVADNRTIAGRARNRRIEFELRWAIR